MSRPAESEAREKIGAAVAATREAAGAVAAEARDRAESAASEVKDRAGAAAGELKDRAEAAVAHMRDSAVRSAETLRDAAVDRAAEARDSVADAGIRLSDSLNRAAESGDPASLSSRALSMVAGGIAEAAEGLNGASLSSLLADGRALARRHPVACAVGAAVVGFALVRLLGGNGREDASSEA